MSKTMLIRFIIIILIIPTQSMAQKKFEIIAKEVSAYEFNADRSKVFFVVNENKLFVYNIEHSETQEIILNDKVNSIRQLIADNKNELLIFTNIGLSIIQNEKLALSAVRLDIFSPLPDNSPENRSKRINSLIHDKSVLEIKQSKLYYVFIREKGESVLVQKSELEYADEKKMKETVENAQAFLFTNNKHYHRENKFPYRTLNRFGENIRVNERAYLCKTGDSFMSSILKCKYKVKIKAKKLNAVFRDKSRNTRFIARGWGKPHWNCNLYERLPYSKYISDKNGNIYLLINSKEQTGKYDLIQVKR